MRNRRSLRLCQRIWQRRRQHGLCPILCRQFLSESPYRSPGHALQEGLDPVAVKEMVYQATDYLGYGRALPFLHATNNAAFLTKVVLQCLPYIGYPPSLNAMGCIAKAAKQ